MSRGGKPFIPRADGDCAAWAVRFLAACNDFETELGLTPEQVTEIKNAVDPYIAALATHTAAQAAAEAAAANKREQRAEMERVVRTFTRTFQSLPAMTDALRARLGITVPTGTLTPSPAPTTAPTVSVELPSRLTHTLRLTDSATPTRTAKPRGAMGAEVWVALTPPGESAPTDPHAYRYCQLATRETVHRTFDSEAGGQTAHYQLRWVSTRGEHGPWSEVASATIAA